eukprot:CAMPEP_0197644628 /NCGR_PEP_ID=MMETSP1338-20131121/17538_1 /TAXON_ID=43686 ORGANISM="Pelagodinium beii, Strain RCC1491" /NCGR_SAMPLE_ID=MMETSP1338 /ASSEMBLY_ACC=CAM_ASM_000754 /LENGTH=121 /DNA_ID=CAMNT_0043218057 /DNA_START=109 /DNA_END=474 /DNA_ORIENTATION=+
MTLRLAGRMTELPKVSVEPFKEFKRDHRDGGSRSGSASPTSESSYSFTNKVCARRTSTEELLNFKAVRRLSDSQSSPSLSLPLQAHGKSRHKNPQSIISLVLDGDEVQRDKVKGKRRTSLP